MKKSLVKKEVKPLQGKPNLPRRKGNYEVKLYNFFIEGYRKFDPKSKCDIDYWLDAIDYYWDEVYVNRINSNQQKLEAILIDPFLESVIIIQTEGVFKEVCKILGCSDLYGMHIYHFSKTDIIYRDEDAWVNSKLVKGKVGFTFNDWNYMFLGKCLILGENPENNDPLSCETKISEIKATIRWLDAYTIFEQGKLKNLF